MGYDAAVGLREFVGIGGACARMAAAPAVEVFEKQLSFDRHVQLPERVPTAPPEETLQREDSTQTDAKGLHGGALGMHGPCAIWVCTRKDLRVEMRVRDLLCLHTYHESKKTHRRIKITERKQPSQKHLLGGHGRQK